MKEDQSTKSIPIQIGNFEGILMVMEKVVEDGNLVLHAGYYIQNRLTKDILAGLAGDLESIKQQITSRVQNYQEQHPEETKELLKKQNDNDSTQTGVHPESE